MLCSIKTTDTLSQPMYHQQREEALAFNLTKTEIWNLKYKVLKHAQNKVFVITKQSIFFGQLRKN